MRKRITEYLDINLEQELWMCRKCDYQLISAHSSYKKGCLVYEREPSEIYEPHIEGEYTFSPDPGWTRIIEFYCPGCGTLVETEILPPGHPITHDIELDIEALKDKYLSKKEG